MRFAALSLALLSLSGCATVDPSVLNDSDKMMQVVFLLAMLAFILFSMGPSIGKTIKYLAIYGVLLLALILAYSYRSDFDSIYYRIKGELLPSHPQAIGDGIVTLRRDRDGHFSTRALVNGIPGTFLIDTGASSVVLPFRTAQQLGYAPDRLPFTLTVGTANGRAVAAPIIIEEMEINGIIMRRVGAMVVEEGKLSQPLLGMSFLNRLSGFNISGNTLTLTR